MVQVKVEVQIIPEFMISDLAEAKGVDDPTSWSFSAVSPSAIQSTELAFLGVFSCSFLLVMLVAAGVMVVFFVCPHGSAGIGVTASCPCACFCKILKKIMKEQCFWGKKGCESPMPPNPGPVCIQKDAQQCVDVTKLDWTHYFMYYKYYRTFDLSYCVASFNKPTVTNT